MKDFSLIQRNTEAEGYTPGLCKSSKSLSKRLDIVQDRYCELGVTGLVESKELDLRGKSCLCVFLQKEAIKKSLQLEAQVRLS